MLPPRSVKAATAAIATSAAATAYSESSSPVSSWKNLLIIVFAPYALNYPAIVFASWLILTAMLPPRSVKAATAAIATSAAATAYSESSSPVSSWKNLLIMVLLLIVWLGVTACDAFLLRERGSLLQGSCHQPNSIRSQQNPSFFQLHTCVFVAPGRQSELQAGYKPM